MKNQTLMTILGFIRNASFAAKVDSKRDKMSFIADRLVQSFTQPTLLGACHRLMEVLDCDPGEMRETLVAEIIRIQDGAPERAWIRKYPKLAAMILFLKKEDFAPTIESIDLTEMTGWDGVCLSPKYEIPMRVTCLSPLAHGSDTKAGNATLFRRGHSIATNRAKLYLPFYAGGAVRGVMRDLLADDFLTSLGLLPRRDKPPVALWFFHTLYSGGMLSEGSEAEKALRKTMGGVGEVKTEEHRRFRDTLPALSLLGCGLGNRMLPGRIQVGDLRPECKEYGTGEDESWKLMDWIFLTRHEDYENYEAGEHTGMIATTEVLKAGTILRGGIDYDRHCRAIELSALGRGLELLSERGYLGADNRRGVGKVRFEVENLPDSTMYKEHLKSRKDEILGYLREIGGVV